MDASLANTLIGAIATIIAAILTAVATIVAARKWNEHPMNISDDRTKSVGVSVTQQKLPVIIGSESIDIETAISILVAEGGIRRKTATPGSSYYETAKKLKFSRCECSYSDTAYGAHEFISKSARGKYYYVSYYLATGEITCGPHGYHEHNSNVRECI